MFLFLLHPCWTMVLAHGWGYGLIMVSQVPSCSYSWLVAASLVVAIAVLCSQVGSGSVAYLALGYIPLAVYIFTGQYTLYSHSHIYYFTLIVSMSVSKARSLFECCCAQNIDCLGNAALSNKPCRQWRIMKHYSARKDPKWTL